MKKGNAKDIKKVMIYFIPLLALVLQNLGFPLVTSQDLEAFFNVSMSLLIAFGILSNNDKFETTEPPMSKDGEEES